jgi:exodeoxyribonuclease V alpha subunit
MATFAPTSPDTSPTEHLTGAVERVTFHSEETGFCVLRVKVRGHRDLVTVVGTAATITPGEYIEGQGVWVNDRTHGLQFKTQALRVVPPSTLEGIEKYLGSGMVKGIGPHFAKKLVQAFKEDDDTARTHPHRIPQRHAHLYQPWQMASSALRAGSVPCRPCLQPENLILQDKIIGKATALLIHRLGFRTVKAGILSRRGEAVLQRHGIAYTSEQLVDRIHCQTEELLATVEDSEEAYQLVKVRAGR